MDLDAISLDFNVSQQQLLGVDQRVHEESHRVHADWTGEQVDKIGFESCGCSQIKQNE